MSRTITASQLLAGDHVTGLPGQRTSGRLLVAQRPAQRDGDVLLVLRERCSVGYLQPVEITLPGDLQLRIERG